MTRFIFLRLIITLHAHEITASQMWCLGRLLPGMIGEFVPEGDPFWRNYLQLLHIIEQVFSPVISSGTAPYVQVLLETFHELYPTHTIILKILHLPCYLERYCIHVHLYYRMEHVLSVALDLL